MSVIRIHNSSTLTDMAAVIRVAMYMSGDEKTATKENIDIKERESKHDGNTDYYIRDRQVQS
ncbi:MAG: hypothetical protein PHP50_10100 [Lachnospiraceae bacterium]|nr:hypothetical protein [Lachnospiraceae bacterium]